MSADSTLLALFGGALIGLAASGLLLFNGRIAGISGICGGLLPPRAGDASWRLAFVLGMLAGGAMMAALRPGTFGMPGTSSWPVLIAAGLLVGVGTRLGNGCTSGHGVCGLARRSSRSLVATLTFMAAAIVTVYIVRHVLQGPA